MSYQPSPDKDSGITVTIERPPPRLLPPPTMGTIDDVDSDHTLTPTSTHNQPLARHQLSDHTLGDRPMNEHADSKNPFSPFYDHAEATTTLSLQQPPISKQNTKLSKASTKVYDSDLEAGWDESKADFLDKAVTKTKTKDCTVWPGQKTLKNAKRAEKLQRRGQCYNPMRGLEARTKLLLKILIAAVIVGAAVGMGLGISKAMGSGIWTPQDH